MKTRHYIFLFGIVLFLLSCETPEKIPDVLPPITHEGANTFGAYIKGNIFVPLDNTFRGISFGNVPVLTTSMDRFYEEDNIYIVVRLTNRNRIRDEQFMLRIRSDSILPGDQYILPSLGHAWNPDGAGVAYKLKVDHHKFVDFVSDTLHPFIIQIHHLVRDTTSGFNNRIIEISATFSGDLVDETGKIVEVKEGRFDLQTDLWITE